MSNELSASFLRSLTKKKRKEVLGELTDNQCLALVYDWDTWARPNQRLPPGNWFTWLILAGRGYGKTRTGAETVRQFVESGKYGRIGLIGPTAADVRDTMVEGESGILACSPPWMKPLYTPSKRKLEWPNGAVAITYSAEKPDSLRGPNHDLVWEDEKGAWKYPEETSDMASFGLRLGADPRRIITTTPKPLQILRDSLKDPSTFTTRGSTYENRENLAKPFFDVIVRKYEGTNLGRQELYAEILDDIEGALWSRDMFERNRLRELPVPLKRIVIGVDPSVTGKDTSDACGIVAAGLGADNKGYLLDSIGIIASPTGWARKAIGYYYQHSADRLIAEINNGGEMVELTIRTIDQNISYKGIHASKGKYTRAEPIAALYEQDRIKHVGHHAAYEDECCTYEPNAGRPSPNIMDAGVWAFTELMLTGKNAILFKPNLNETSKKSAFRR